MERLRNKMPPLLLRLIFLCLIASCSKKEAVPSDEELINLFNMHEVLFREAAQNFINSGYSRIDKELDGKILVDAKPSNPDTELKYDWAMKMLDIEVIRKESISPRSSGVAFLFYRDGLVSAGGCVKGIIFVRSPQDLPVANTLNDVCGIRPKSNNSIIRTYRQITGNWYLFSRLD